MEKTMHINHLALGVCYYPEHWDEHLWQEDLRRMKEHGIECVRVGEFAWSKIEATEGHFDFSFFDRFLDLCSSEKMNVIFCTPTCTPPAWLTEKYPETLNARQDGVLYRHGLRQHHNYTSETYLSFCDRIITQMAMHYGHHPSIVGWQLDNECNCEVNVYYSESDHKAFREFLKEQFGTLENLNDKMGTVFWNQTYTSWDEIYLPRTVTSPGFNPHMKLMEKRFVSAIITRYLERQSAILRRYIPDNVFITTNGIFGHLDSHEMTQRALSFMTYDNYPNFAFDEGNHPNEPGAMNDRRFGWNLTRTRSISPNFGVMEQQSGPGGWVSRIRQPSPKPGQMRLWTWQAIAHGADFVSYFRWRTAPVGTEIYWHGLLNYDNEPNRRLRELKKIAAETEKMAALAGSRYQARIAMVKDYSNEWDSEQDNWRRQDVISDYGWFEAGQVCHTPMDFVYLPEEGSERTVTVEDLLRYDVLVYPHPTILTKPRADLLRRYAERGGTLILGVRTGYKDEYGRCPMRPMPGYAMELAGVKVEDFTLLCEADGPETVMWGGERLPAPEFNEVLLPLPGTKAVGFFCGNYYDGRPALTERQVGKGKVYYYGAAFNRETAVQFLKKLHMDETFGDWVEAPWDVEVAVRKKDGKKTFFLLNYKAAPRRVMLHREMENSLTGEKNQGPVEIPAYGVLILHEKA